MVCAFYLASIYLLAFATKAIAAAFIHPVATSEWPLRYALTIGTLELVAAGFAGITTALVAAAVEGEPRWSLPACGMLSAVTILLMPHAFTAAASTMTISWSILVHAVAPALLGLALSTRAHSR